MKSQVKIETKKEFKYLDMNENEKIMYSDQWDTRKAVLKVNIAALSAYIKKLDTFILEKQKEIKIRNLDINK